MHYPQKYNSVGFVLDKMNVTIADDNEIIANNFPTGDLGHIDEQGFLFITGRKKETIIKGGWKIMPYEVEKALLESGATDAVVFGYDTVYAEVVGTVDMDSLKSKLAHYKIPKIFTVDAVKRKGQGKINRKELLNEYIKNRKS
jgi:acyl-CoA synthetase (AMP-forming)/AMP-acid ligase II